MNPRESTPGPPGVDLLLACARWCCAPLLAAVIAAVSQSAAAQTAVVSIEADGTAFRAKLSDGSERRGVELAGTALVFRIDGRALRLRIASVVPDPADKTGSILL